MGKPIPFNSYAFKYYCQQIYIQNAHLHTKTDSWMYLSHIAKHGQKKESSFKTFMTVLIKK